MSRRAAPAMRLVAPLAGLALLALAADAAAQEANVFQAAEQCVTREAGRLEVSREAADVIAQAALAKCGLEMQRAAAALKGGQVAMLREDMREAALVHVVELRAQRYAPKPPAKPKRR